MPKESLQDLLVEDLKDLFDAEKQITRALPKMVKKATSEELRAGLEQHLQQTEEQIERLVQVFQQLGVPARGKKCPGMQGLIEEGSEHMQEHEKGAGLDAVIIAAAQKVEHYEMAAYGTLRTWATQLGHTDVAELLDQTLEEEKSTDEKLTQLAEGLVNPEAASGDDEGDEAGDEPSARSGSARSGKSMAAERSGGGRKGSTRAGSSRSRSRSR
jgi:ferritin-like metal-binding protein YciE